MAIPHRVLPRPLGMLAYLAAWLTPGRPVYRCRAARSNLVFHVHRADVIGRHIAKYGVVEPLQTRWMAEFLSAAPRGIVVDVGANLGWHTLHAARHPHVESVVAFEPDAFNADLLERNLAANDIRNVVVDRRAVAAASGQAALYRYRDTNLGRHSLASDHGYGSRPVPVTDLDGALEGLGQGERPVTLLKIDVEGHEPAVIAGAAKTLARTDAVLLECSPQASGAAAPSRDDMLARLQAAGFAPYVLVSTGGTACADYDELRRLQIMLDVIFVRKSRLPELARGIGERPRTARTLVEIAEQNRQIVTPV